MTGLVPPPRLPPTRDLPHPPNRLGASGRGVCSSVAWAVPGCIGGRGVVGFTCASAPGVASGDTDVRLSLQKQAGCRPYKAISAAAVGMQPIARPLLEIPMTTRTSVNLFTPRDLLNLTDNPAELCAVDIARMFGVSVQRARDVRDLACRAPEVRARQLARLIDRAPWWRPLGHDA